MIRRHVNVEIRLDVTCTTYYRIRDLIFSIIKKAKRNSHISKKSISSENLEAETFSNV